MPYSMPSLDDLHRTSANLTLEFNRKLGRYIPPSYENLCQQILVMKQLMKKECLKSRRLHTESGSLIPFT